MSFIWGIFIFDEPIHSKTGASFAILCLIFGLFGMSFFSSHAVDDNSAETSFPTNTTSLMEGTAIYRDFESAVATSAEDPDETDTDCTNTTERSVIVMSRSPSYSDNLNAEWHSGQETSSSPLPSNIRTDHSPESENITVQVHVWGQKISKRRLGMMSAAFCGIWGGSIMVPMKFCQSDTKGTHYLLSFAIGAAIVNIAVWMIRFIFHVAQERSFARGFQQLPSFHVRVMWLAGLTSGLLWSIGNFFSMISVFYLGEGVGYPLVQTSIFVAGLWGIFYFKEVRGRERICRWLLSATSTVFGILLLSYEHHKS